MGKPMSESKWPKESLSLWGPKESVIWEGARAGEEQGKGSEDGEDCGTVAGRPWEQRVRNTARQDC